MSAEDTDAVLLVVDDSSLAALNIVAPHWSQAPRAVSVNDMWLGLEGGRFPIHARLLLFSADVPADPGDLALAIATMSQHVPVGVLVWDESGIETLRAEIASCCQERGLPPVNVTWLNAAGPAVLLEDLTPLCLSANVAPPEAAPSPAAPVPPPVAPSAAPPAAAAVNGHGPSPASQSNGHAELPTPTGPAIADPAILRTLPPPGPAVGYTQPPATPLLAPPGGADLVEEITGYGTRPAGPLQHTICVTSGKGGSGKCSEGSTLIVDPVTGRRHTLKELVDNPAVQSSVLAFDGTFIREARIGQRYASGTKPVWEFRTRSGRALRLTAEHPVLTPDGWRPAGSVAVGDALAGPARLPHPTRPTSMDDAELDLLAVLLAEGGTSRSTTLFTTADPLVLDIVATACVSLGLRLHHSPAKMQYAISGRARSAAATCDETCGCAEAVLADDAPSILERIRETHGLAGTLAKHKTMPQAIFQLPEAQLARFLSVFWMCDGYVGKPDVRGGPDVGVTLASEPLVEAFQHLLLRFGVQSRISSRIARNRQGAFAAYRLTVITSSYPALARTLNLWGEKATRLAAIAAEVERTSNPNVGCPAMSDTLYQRLVDAGRPGVASAAMKRLGWNLSKGGPSMVLTTGGRRDGRKRLSLKGLSAYLADAGLDAQAEFGWICDSEIVWDDVAEIVPLGERPVYDIEVPDLHNFVANDMVVHNSTTAVMLATTIAQTSGGRHRVCVVDLDIHDGQLPAFVGRHMPTALNLRAEPVINEETVSKFLIPSPELGFDALLAPLRPRTAASVTPEFYREVIHVLQRMYTVVVLDTSVRYLDNLLTEVAFPESSAILFVTTLASSAVQSMARALREMLGSPDNHGLGIPASKVGVVINQSVADVGMSPDLVLEAAVGAPIVASIPLATHDMLYATNTRQMHRLLVHRDLGPAYFKLAQTALNDDGALTPPSQIASRLAPVAAAAPSASNGKTKQRRGLLARAGR